MAKKVRVENADASATKIVVEVWQAAPAAIADTKLSEQLLGNPADLAEITLGGGRYLRVYGQA